MNYVQSLNDWKYYCFLSDNNKAKVFVDGVLAKEGLQSNNFILGSTVILGTSLNLGQGSIPKFNGWIDELYIYDRVLSSSEVEIIYYAVGNPINSFPQDLNSTASLSISENQIIGTVVGDFNATDPDGDGMTYQLVSGAGDGNNTLFTLEPNGILKTATVLDHEDNPGPLSVRVQVKDDYNATMEGIFSITIIDTVDFTVVINVENNGTVTGAGQYDEGASVNVAATPGLGFVFNGWLGDFNSSEANETITVNNNYTFAAIFGQDTEDGDGDGLSNYEELVIYLSDPNDSDSDNDSLSDGQEVQIGLDPNSANHDLVSYFFGMERGKCK